jgi:putative transcriptional regulator
MSSTSGPRNKGRADLAKISSQSRSEINDVARRQRAQLGLDKRSYSTRLVSNVPVPDVRTIRETLGLSQAAFATRFHLSERTVQQWEQGRALPDRPARVLLRTIEISPDVVATAAMIVGEEEQRMNRRRRAPHVTR